MTYRITRRARHFTAVAALIGIATFLPGWMPAYGDSTQVSNLLQQAKTAATQLKEDTIHMESFVSSQTSWRAHAHQVNMVKTHVNNLGQILNKLQNARAGAAPWQQDVIDKMLPKLKKLAGTTTAEIDYLNGTGLVWSPVFQTYLKQNAEVAKDLSNMLNDYIAYGQANSKSEMIAKQHGIPQS